MSASGESGDESRPPRPIATDARDDALEAFQEVNQLDDVVEQAQQAQETAQNFADGLATAVAKGLSTSQAKSFCGMVADASDHYTKTSLIELLEEKVEEKRTEESNRRPFGQVIREDLREVVIVRTTDAKQSTKYRWEFEAGSVETTATSEGREHFHWSNFRDEYFDATGEDPMKPDAGLRDGEDWREFIVELIENRGREVETRGPRSAAIDDLKNHIRHSKAYSDIEAMVERDGVYLDADPENGDPDELWVQNHAIKRVCDENELNTVRSLQLELDARGYTVDRMQGVSESKTVNNNKATYWVLRPELADPAEFVVDPQDPADQVREEEEEEAEEDDEDDDDDDEPGLIGSAGG